MSVVTVLRRLIFAYAIVFSLWPFYVDIRIQENVGINPQRLILIVIGFLFIVSIALLKGFERRAASVWRENRDIFLPVFIYGCLRLAAGVLGGAYSFVTVINELVGNLFLMFVSAIVFRDAAHFRRFLICVAWCAGIVAAFAVFERILEYNFLTRFADESTKAGFTALSDKVRDGVYRVQSTFEHPLSLTQYLAMTIPLLYALRSRVGVLIFPVALLLGAALWFTGSRSALVALFLSVVAIVILWAHGRYRNQTSRQGRNKYLSILTALYVVVAVGGVGMVGSAIVGEGSDSQSASSVTRLVQINNGLIAVTQKPFLGHGPGEGSRVIMGIGETAAGGETVYKETTDNLFLTILVESGVPSLLVYLLMIKRVMSLVASNVVGARDKVAMAMNASLFAALLAGVTLMSILSIFTILPLFFILMGAAVGVNRRGEVGAFGLGVRK